MSVVDISGLATGRESLLQTKKKKIGYTLTDPSGVLRVTKYIGTCIIFRRIDISDIAATAIKTT